MTAQMNPVNWFEIPVNDLKRAKEFYEYIFGFDMELSEMGNLKMAWFPSHRGADGATGTLIKAESYVPSHSGSMVYFTVADIEEVLAKVTEKGGKVLNPKMSIGEYGFVAHFEDCEGNRVALHAVS
jgi:predicted enzyme related to lactoylglutathione lyase